MNLRHLSNSELHIQTKIKAENERFATIELLWHLREVEKRMLYAQMGYPDLKMYCVKELKLSETSAWRKINAMRLLKEVPEIESKIQSGDLNLTQLSLARSHFTEVKASIQEKKEILLSLENQSTRTTERILAEKKPEGYIPRPIEKEKALRGQKIELTLVLDEAFQKDLEEIELLSGKKYSKLELFKLMTKATLERLRKKSAIKVSDKSKQLAQTEVVSKNTSFKNITDSTALKKAEQVTNFSLYADNNMPCKKFSLANDSKFMQNKDLTLIIECETQTNKTIERKAQPALKTSSAKNSRYIPAATRNFILIRDQRRCQYVDAVSKRQCEAKHFIEFEHKQAFAKGGSHEPKNLQLLCRAHNKLRAIQVFGAKKMQQYQPLLR